ncbi:MAG: GntR family transcriptional regulator [Spirochaetales bacterium]|nr:GntR family transcriptional regulator [Spirochaetales bacterium]
MNLNTQSPVPLYYQLAQIILDKIRTGDYPSESKIPSEQELSSTYGLGRPTVRQATELLVRQRILRRKRGSGTFVVGMEEEIDLFSLGGTMSAFEKKDITLNRMNVKQIGLVRVDSHPDNPFSGRRAYFFSRLSAVGEEAFLIEDIYLAPDIFPDIDAYDFSQTSLSRVILEQYRMRPTHGKQSFTIRYADVEKSALFKIDPKTPILLVRRYLHFPLMENAIYSELSCLTDRFIFTQKIGGFDNE